MLKTLKTLVYLLTSIALLVSFETGAMAAKKSKTLKKTQKMGFVRCGVSQGLPGFSNADASGNWTGVDVDLCRGGKNYDLDVVHAAFTTCILKFEINAQI